MNVRFPRVAPALLHVSAVSPACLLVSFIYMGLLMEWKLLDDGRPSVTIGLSLSFRAASCAHENLGKCLLNECLVLVFIASCGLAVSFPVDLIW